MFGYLGLKKPTWIFNEMYYWILFPFEQRCFALAEFRSPDSIRIQCHKTGSPGWRPLVNISPKKEQAKLFYLLWLKKKKRRENVCDLLESKDPSRDTGCVTQKPPKIIRSKFFIYNIAIVLSDNLVAKLLWSIKRCILNYSTGHTGHLTTVSQSWLSNTLLGCLAGSLASAQYIPVAPASCDNQKCV